MNAGLLHVRVPGSVTVTDLGRPNGSRFGVPTGGALDRGAAQRANVLVGNAPTAPVMQITAFDSVFVTDIDILLATAGANCTLLIDGVHQPTQSPVAAPAGSTIEVTQIRRGLHTYLAVRGSFDVPRLLGSCAPDIVLGFGAPLAANDTLAVRTATTLPPHPHLPVNLFRFDKCPDLRETRPEGSPEPWLVDLTTGPDIAEFGDTAQRLAHGQYTVGPASNSIGLRLAGHLPERQTSGEVLSRGVPVGAVEVPPGNELLILHRGRGVTAGYPVLAVVSATGLDTLAQARPGDHVRFRYVSVTDAVARARRRDTAIHQLAERVNTAFTALGIPALPVERIST